MNVVCVVSHQWVSLTLSCPELPAWIATKKENVQSHHAVVKHFGVGINLFASTMNVTNQSQIQIYNAVIIFSCIFMCYTHGITSFLSYFKFGLIHVSSACSCSISRIVFLSRSILYKVARCG